MRPRGGLLIRHKLHLLVVIPLSGLLLATVPLVVERAQQASNASDLASLMDTADRIGALVQDVQKERLLSIASLASPQADPNAFVVQCALVASAATDLRRSLGDRLTSALGSALDRVTALGSVRAQVLTRTITPNRLDSTFDDAISALIDAVGLIHPQAAGASGTAAESALDALFRADEYRGTVGGALLASVAAPSGAAGALGTVDRAAEAERVEITRFKQLATPEQARLFRLAEFGTAAALFNDLQGQIESARTSGTGGAPGLTASSSPADRMALVDRLADAVTAQYGLRVLVEEKIAHDVAVDAEHSARTETVTAVAFSVAIEALVVVAIALSVSIRRSVSQPLRGLTEAAIEVADLAEGELRRVADADESGPRAPMPRLAAVRVTSTDEVGILAEAFNRVQATSARLLERQILSRRNVAAMYGSIGRRTLNLVRRQLAIIDALEAEEIDDERLGQLFQLDHYTSRLQRSANSLIVLSGMPREQAGSGPLSLRDAIRAALGAVEDYRRIQPASVIDDVLAPAAVGDVVLVLSELMANAVSFSPPEDDVEVSAYRIGGARCVRIVDHGLGMPADRMERENVRLVSRERLDLAPTDLLGLFVVGRLARRHGLSVTLTPTEGGGVTVFVVLPDRLFLEEEPAAASPGAGVGAGTDSEAGGSLDGIRAAVQKAMRSWSGDAARPDPGSGDPESEAPGFQPCLDPGVVPKPLVRRIPGAQLPAGTGAAAPVSRVPADPEAVRAEIEAFEAGAARAALYEQRMEKQ